MDEPQTYTDADWGSNLHRKSFSGYIVILSGGAVAWSSKKQSTVALSTAEAEYIAATHATKQILWQRYLFKELDLPHDDTSILKSLNKVLHQDLTFRIGVMPKQGGVLEN